MRAVALFAILGFGMMTVRTQATEGAADLPVVDLTIDQMNKLFFTMNVGDDHRLEGLNIGDNYIQIAKPSEDTLRVIAYYWDQVKQIPLIAYIGNYKFISEVNSLVAVECSRQDFTPTPVPTASIQCNDAIKTAATLLNIILTADIKDINDSGFSKMAECIKQKTTTVTSTTFNECFIQVMGDPNYAQAAVRDKINALQSQGFTCDENGRCTKTDQTSESTIDDPTVIQKYGNQAATTLARVRKLKRSQAILRHSGIF